MTYPQVWKKRTPPGTGEVVSGQDAWTLLVGVQVCKALWGGEWLDPAKLSVHLPLDPAACALRTRGCRAVVGGGGEALAVPLLSKSSSAGVGRLGDKVPIQPAACLCFVLLNKVVLFFFF